MRFENPQTPRGVMLGGHEARRRVRADPARRRPGAVPGDRQAPAGGAGARRAGCSTTSSSTSTRPGSRSTRPRWPRCRWRELVAATGVPEKALRRVAERVRTSKATIVCWAMGLTQHKHAVATLRDVVNVLLLQGNIGRAGRGRVPGARALERAGRPHDGHLREAVRALPRRARPRVRLHRAARARATTPSRRSARCATARPASSWRWAATSSRPRPTRTSSRLRCATSISPCRCPRS